MTRQRRELLNQPFQRSRVNPVFGHEAGILIVFGMDLLEISTERRDFQYKGIELRYLPCTQAPIVHPTGIPCDMPIKFQQERVPVAKFLRAGVVGVRQPTKGLEGRTEL